MWAVLLELGYISKQPEQAMWSKAVSMVSALVLPSRFMPWVLALLLFMMDCDCGVSQINLFLPKRVCSWCLL